MRQGIGGMMSQKKERAWSKTGPSTTLYTTNPMWSTLELNPDRHGEKLSAVSALVLMLLALFQIA